MIESVEVLKDAAAASIYGSRLVMVRFWSRQKRGKKVRRFFSANVSYTLAQLMGVSRQTGRTDGTLVGSLDGSKL